MPDPGATRVGRSVAADRAPFLRLIGPPVVGGLILALVVALLAGIAYALVLLVVVVVVAGAITLVRLQGRSNGPDGSQSSDASTPHQGFDGSALGDTDQLSGAHSTGSAERDRAEEHRS